MSWVQIVIAALGLAREVIKLARERSANTKTAAERIKLIKAATTKARMEKNTDELEASFRELNLPRISK